MTRTPAVAQRASSSWAALDLTGADGRREHLVSIVAPVFRCRDSLTELYCRLRNVLETQHLPYEIVFVDDACPENSLAVLTEVASGDPSVATVALERNVGQQRAVLAGLARARGTRVVVMDADLQDPPEAIPALLTKLDEGFDAVFAGRRGRHASLSRLSTSRVFKWLLHLLCGTPTDAGLFVAMSKLMVDRLLSFDAPGPSVLAMIGCTGLPLASVPVTRAPRREGRSGYSSWKRLRLCVSTLVWVIARIARSTDNGASLPTAHDD